MRLFHAGYVDRPRAQLDRFPYRLRALRLCPRQSRARACSANETAPKWGRKKTARSAGPSSSTKSRSSISRSALEQAVAQRSDVQLIAADDMIAHLTGSGNPRGRSPFRPARKAFAWREGGGRPVSFRISCFGLQLATGKRRNFMVEIDRGTMPVRRLRSGFRRASKARCASTSPRHCRQAARAAIRVEEFSRG